MRLIPLSKLKPGQVIGKDVLFGSRILLRNGHTLSEREISSLVKRGFTSVYIDDGVELDTDPKGSISQATREAAVDILYDVFQHSDKLSASRIKSIESATDLIISDIMSNDDIKIQIQDIRSHDDYTYRHSVNVTAISVAIGKMMGFQPEQLKVLGISGMLYEIGLTQVPRGILHKKTSLSQYESRWIRQHPEWGFEILSEGGHTDPIVWAVSMQHHERMDGSGYPGKRRGKEIHQFTRIISVADVWDALRSERPFRAPLSAEQVIRFLQDDELHMKFDKKAIDHFLEIAAPFPIGSVVELTTGEQAIVISNDTDDKYRPEVRVLWSRTGDQYKKPDQREIKLAEERDLDILRTIY